MTDTNYDHEFYELHRKQSLDSARRVLPLVFQYVQPASVVDVGCGEGAWLSEFCAAGVRDYLGVDGDYVDRAKLLIEPERFQAADLAQGIDLGRRFDLAVCLEVAEHLPQSAAGRFVSSLAALSDVVLFSAAIPQQLGTDHINLQWPGYWREMFARHGYEAVDCLRRPLWDDALVAWWYRQNIMFFVNRARLNDFPALDAAIARGEGGPPLALVHPSGYFDHLESLYRELRRVQKVAMRHALGLQKANLALFPDWSRPEVAREQLRSALSALSAHPDRQSMTLVIQAGGEVPRQLSLSMKTLAESLPAEVRAGLSAGPKISTVHSEFGRDEWEVLLECLNCRLTLPGEDQTAIAAAGAASCPALTLAELSCWQPMA